MYTWNIDATQRIRLCFVVHIRFEVSENTKFLSSWKNDVNQGWYYLSRPHYFLMRLVTVNQRRIYSSPVLSNSLINFRFEYKMSTNNGNQQLSLQAELEVTMRFLKMNWNTFTKESRDFWICRIQTLNRALFPADKHSEESTRWSHGLRNDYVIQIFLFSAYHSLLYST